MMAGTNHNCRGRCKSITIEDAAKLHNVFKNLDERSKIKFIKDCIKSDFSNQREHRSYFLPLQKSTVRVCRQTFLRVFRISFDVFKSQFLYKPRKKYTKSGRFKSTFTDDSKRVKVKPDPFEVDPRVHDNPRSSKANPESLKITIKSCNDNPGCFEVISGAPKDTPGHSKVKTKNSTVNSGHSEIPSGSFKVKLEYSRAISELSKIEPRRFTVNLGHLKVDSESRKVDIGLQTDLSYLSDQAALKVIQPKDQTKTIRITTMMNIMKNPLLFVGVKSTETIVQIRNALRSTNYDLLIVFQKIRLNSSLRELALYYETTVEEVSNILNVYTQLIAHTLLDMLEWQNPAIIKNEMKLDLRLKFDSVRSIIKLLRVKMHPVGKVYKCFVSFSPLGVISYVSLVVSDDEPNVLMFNERFLNEAPKNCGIVLERDLMDVTDFLDTQGHTIFVRSKIENDAFYDEPTNRLCCKVDEVFDEFLEFEIFRHFEQSSFTFLSETESLQNVVVIVAGLLNVRLSE